MTELLKDTIPTKEDDPTFEIAFNKEVGKRTQMAFDSLPTDLKQVAVSHYISCNQSKLNRYINGSNIKDQSKLDEATRQLRDLLQDLIY